MTNEIKDKSEELEKVNCIILAEISSGDEGTVTKIFNCSIRQFKEIVKRRKYEVVKSSVMTYQEMIDALWNYSNRSEEPSNDLRP